MLCDKQIQSSIQIHKFKFKFRFLLTVLNPLTHSLLDHSAIFLPCPDLLSRWELPSSRPFDSDYFQPSSHQPIVYYPSIQLAARSSRTIGSWCKCSRQWHFSTFAQARWRERASEAWRAEQLSQNPSVPWTVLPMPAADAAQRRVSLYRSSHVRADIWTLRWRVCGWVCQELLRLSRLVVILDEEIYRNDLHIIANQYHWKECIPKLESRWEYSLPEVSCPVACDDSTRRLSRRRLGHNLPSASPS